MRIPVVHRAAADWHWKGVGVMQSCQTNKLYILRVTT